MEHHGRSELQHPRLGGLSVVGPRLFAKSTQERVPVASALDRIFRGGPLSHGNFYELLSEWHAAMAARRSLV
jgi:hypothetical protein